MFIVRRNNGWFGQPVYHKRRRLRCPIEYSDTSPGRRHALMNAIGLHVAAGVTLFHAETQFDDVVDR